MIVRTELPWPLFTIDVEASGLGEFTYPIEIGITSWPSPEAEISTWSTLISPPPAWRQHRIWSREGQAIHGITRDQLEVGSTPLEALAKANELIGPHLAFCDGGEHDLRWLLHLAQAAAIRPSFRLGDWRSLVGALPGAQHAQMTRWFSAEPVVHRAGPDAERLMKGLAAGLMAAGCGVAEESRS